MTSYKTRIWILEDDTGCQYVYEQTLAERYDLRFFSSINELVEILENSNKVQAEILIADLMLKDGNFLEFFQDIEKQDSYKRLRNLPIVVVSSVDDVDALRTCFKQGVVDYLVKPFKKNELLAKLEKILVERYHKNQYEKTIVLDGLEIIDLTRKQKQLLNLFLKSGERTVEREAILDEVWGGIAVHPKTVDVHLYNLRRKLQPYGYLIRSEGGGVWSLMSQEKELNN